MCVYMPLCRDFQNSLRIYTQATETDSSACISISEQIYISYVRCIYIYLCISRSYLQLIPTKKETNKNVNKF